MWINDGEWGWGRGGVVVVRCWCCGVDYMVIDWFCVVYRWVCIFVWIRVCCVSRVSVWCLYVGEVCCDGDGEYGIFVVVVCVCGSGGLGDEFGRVDWVRLCVVCCYVEWCGESCVGGVREGVVVVGRWGV